MSSFYTLSFKYIYTLIDYGFYRKYFVYLPIQFYLFMMNLEETLRKIGLSESEASVYLACLLAGSNSVKEISKHTKIERTNLYRVIERLQKKGLVEVVYQGLKKNYKAVNPNVLSGILQKTEEEFKNALPNLVSLYSDSESIKIKISKGEKSLVQEYNSLLHILSKDDFYYVISNLEKWKNLDFYNQKDFINKRIKKDIFIKMIAQNSETAVYNQRFEKNFRQQVKILKDTFPLQIDVVITPKKIIIVTFSNPITIYTIEDRNLILSYKTFFEIMWSGLL